MSKKKEYPYENLETTDLPGEQWKPIEGFEGRYEVSSYGRIKTLAWERISRHGAIQQIAERIRKQKVEIKTNKKMNDLLFTLMITLRMEGKVKGFSVGRLVYNTFVAKFELSDNSIYISYHDRDSKNLNYQNLYVTNLSEMRSKSYAIGRSESHLSALSKPVSQFDPAGNLIRQYDSMYKAGKITGFNSRNISDVAAGNSLLFKGYTWQLGKNKKLNPSKLPSKSKTEGINQALLAKSGLLQIPSPLPATLDLSLNSHPGERWLGLPGYEELYQISNHGRIKALKKTSAGKQTKWYPETIKYLTSDILTDKGGKPRIGSLCVTLCKNRKKKTIYVARWVYHFFVKPFDIGNPALRIHCKDGDHLNISAKNLELHNADWSINKNKVMFDKS